MTVKETSNVMWVMGKENNIYFLYLKITIAITILYKLSQKGHLKAKKSKINNTNFINKSSGCAKKQMKNTSKTFYMFAIVTIYSILHYC